MISNEKAIRTNIGLSNILLFFAILAFFFIPFCCSASVTLTYEYNALDRLSVAAYGTSFTETYTYDATGNRTGLTVSTGQKSMRTIVPSKSMKPESQK